MIPLVMLVVCSYYGVFTFRVSKNYGLFPYHQTDPSSLLYSCTYIAKLAFPLCYNFICLLGIESGKGGAAGKTALEEVMGVMDLVPILGTDFQQYFPCLIVVFLLLNYFELYSKTVLSRN